MELGEGGFSKSEVIGTGAVPHANKNTNTQAGENWNSMSVHGMTQKTTSTVEEASERLFRNESKVKVEKTANDALLSTLPTETLRFLKKRRKLNSFEKVPLTIYREQQLRAIFNGLDFDKMGTIHLDLVKDAANYAEEKLKPKKGEPVFKNIQRMFEAMDEDGNGDGEVDFHEFTIAMTGSATSTIDSASEYDVERLTKRFIEYANITQREIAIANTEAHFGPDGTMTPASALGTTETNDGASVPMSARSAGTHNTAATSGSASTLHISGESYDADKLDHFRKCFQVFNSRATDESVEEEINNYYELKGVKRIKTSGTKDATKSEVSGKKERFRTADELEAERQQEALRRMPQFKNKALKTQALLDGFLAGVNEFSQTEVSPAFMMRKATETRSAAAAAATLASEECSLAEASHAESTQAEPEDDEDAPIGLVTVVLTAEQECLKREEEFNAMQKQRARIRLSEANAAMNDLDMIENQMRWNEELKYKKNISRKPWIDLASRGSIPKYSDAANRKPTLIPLNDDKVIRTQMKRMIATRTQIKELKLKHKTHGSGHGSRSGSIGGQGEGDFIADAASLAWQSVGNESSAVFSEGSIDLGRVPNMRERPVKKLDIYGKEVRINFNHASGAQAAAVGNHPKKQKKKVRLPVDYVA